MARLEKVRARFAARGIAYATALVTMELAEVHATLGRTATVKALARELAQVAGRHSIVTLNHNRLSVK